MKNLRCLFSFAALSVLCMAAPAQTWTKLANTPPGYLGTALLLTDGTVMVEGETSSGGGTLKWYRLTPDSTGSYVNGTWTTLASMPAGYNPLYFASAVLADGKVTVVGGEYLGSTESETNLGAIYDPAANTWTAITPPTGWTHIGDGASVVLADGTWMIGNCGVTGTECNNQTYQAQLDESNLTWTIIGAGNGKADENSEEGWNLLPNGDVLTVDVSDGKNSEVFNPTTNTWTSAGNTAAAEPSAKCTEIGPAVLSPLGWVFQVGGTANTGVYSISTGTWSAGPTVPSSYGAEDGPASILPDGNVLIQVGPTATCYVSPSVFYEFNGSTLTSVPAPTNAANDATYVGRMLALPTGQVFWTDGSKTAEIYTAAGTYQSAWEPTISTVSATIPSNSANNAISGTQFNGLSQGAAYGDDAQMATNYPLVRITNTASGKVVYAKTHNHSTMGVATGSAIVSTEFDIPSTIQLGLSSLVVVANGIPSGAASIAIQDATSTAASANPSTIANTASTTLSATVTDTSNGANIPTGTVTFTDTTNSATLGSCTLASGTCSITAQGSAMAAGSNSISAAYAGVADTYTASSGTATVTVTVAGPDATSTSVTATPSSINAAGSTTLKATVTDTTNGASTPTGTVTFTDTTNSASLGSCMLASGTCSVTGQGSAMAGGSNTISASYAGVANTYAASSGTTSVTVAADATTTAVTATLNSINAAGSTTLKATVTDTTNGGSTPTGTVTFTDTTNSASLGSCMLANGTCSITGQGSAMAAGSNTISASYAGVANTYAASSGTTSVTVAADATATAVTATPNSISATGSTTLKVTVTDTTNGASTPTGTVTFTDTTNSASLGSCMLASGTCSISGQGSAMAGGSNTISASYAGVANTYAASSGTTSVTVAADATTTAVTATPNSINATGSTTLKATVTDTTNGGSTPTGTVTFTDTTNSASLGSCMLASGTCSVTGQGSAMAGGSNTISASYAGVSGTFGASSGTTTVTVTAASGGTITFSSVSHNFGQIGVGTAATAYGITVTNTGSSAYPFVVNFTPANGFTEANNCPASLAAGAKCQLKFNFTPTKTGAVSATWSLAPEAGFSYSPSNGGTLTGSGTTNGGVSLTSAAHNFGTVTVGMTSPAFGTELSNSTSSPETISLGPVPSGPFSMQTNCGTTLPAGSSCEIEFTFTPTTTSTVQAVVPLSGMPTAITSGGAALPSGGITLTGN